MTPDTWLTGAAFLTWAVAGLPLLTRIASGEVDGARAVVGAIAFCAFGLALAGCMLRRAGVSRREVVALLVVQSAAGLAMVYVEGTGTAGATLAVVAAQLAATLPTVIVWPWVAGHSLVLAAAWARTDGWVAAIAGGGAFAGFQAFSVAAMTLMLRERTAREELARVNVALHATRALLTENTRVAERLRIARDLHDTLGHHLTALSLQLDLASRLAHGQAADTVREAHAITRLLLSDVRDVVSQMRDTGRLDLAAALRALAEGSGSLSVHIDAPGAVDVDDPARAHALLRCVQEIVTNTARHSGARNLWIQLTARENGIALDARDDGRGADAVEWGNGLKGMRERFEEHAGRLDVSTRSGRGFEIHGFMPGARAAS